MKISKPYMGQYETGKKEYFVRWEIYDELITPDGKRKRINRKSDSINCGSDHKNAKIILAKKEKEFLFTQNGIPYIEKYVKPTYHEFMVTRMAKVNSGELKMSTYVIDERRLAPFLERF